MSKRTRKYRSFNKTNLISFCLFVLIVLVCLAFSPTDDTFGEYVQTAETVADTNYNYVHFIDAGQGDSTLIETSDGKFALIDASTQSCTSEVLEYLNNKGVEKLEFVLFTHPHEDHIGGGDEVLKSFDVKTVFMTDRTENTSAYSNLIKELTRIKNEKGTSIIRPENDDTFKLGNIVFTVISDGKKYESTNNSSICVRAELGETSLLFTGDAEAEVENDILQSTAEIDSDIYKCAHHGSSTSNSQAFLDQVSPEIAIVSCGEGNTYGHPHKEVVDAMRERNIPLLRTDIHGNIVIAFNDGSFFLCDSNSK